MMTMKAVIMMAHQPTKLGKDVYGQADKYIEQLKEKYHLTGRQINDIMSRYLGNGDNWSTPASNDDKRQIVEELQMMYKNANQSDRQLISVSMANRSLHTIADVASASVAIELIHLASWRKKQMIEATQSIPQKVWDYGYKLAQQSTHKSLFRKLQREPTHLEHQTALMKELNKGSHRYTRVLPQKEIAQIAKDNASGVNVTVAINRDTVQMMNTLRDTVDTAIQRHANVRDFTRDFAKKFYGTDDLSGGDLYRAERLLRTEYTYTLTNARRLDMLQRGVMYYTNMAVGARNTCKHCLDIDGTSFPVKDMQAGTNAPPFHPNCQCEIIETPSSEVQDGSLFDKNDELLDYFNNEADVDYTSYGQHYVKSMTASGNWPLKLSGKQQNHLEHTHVTTKDPHIKKRSYLYDREDPMNLLKKYSGHGKLKMNYNGWSNKEVISANHFIGVDGKTGKRTRFARIHYGKNGAHIVPILRNGKGK